MIFAVVKCLFIASVSLLNVCEGSIFTDIQKRINSIPAIFTAVTVELPTAIEEVWKLAKIIPDLLMVITDGPFAFAQSQSPEVTDLKNTLQICVEDLSEIINPLKAFDDLININMDLPFFQLPDPDDIIYTLLAVTLLPAKNLVEEACINGVPMISDIANGIIQGADCAQSSFTSIFEEEQNVQSKSECEKHDKPEDDFCESEPIGTPYYEAETVPLNNFNPWRNCQYRQMVDYAYRIITNKYDTSDTEQYVIGRNWRLAFSMVAHIIEMICESLEECIPDIAGCTSAGICEGTKLLFNIGSELLDYALDAAAIHDGEINNVKIDKIFKDSFSIIHNQKLIENNLDVLSVVVEDNKQLLLEQNMNNMNLSTTLEVVHGNMVNLWKEVNRSTDALSKAMTYNQVWNLTDRRRLQTNQYCNDIGKNEMVIVITMNQLCVIILVICLMHIMSMKCFVHHYTTNQKK